MATRGPSRCAEGNPSIPPLVDNDPSRYASELTIAQHTLPIGINNLKRDDEAVSAAREVVSIYRYLARTDGDYLPNLAESLHDLATYLPPTGDQPEALATIQNATEIRRELAHRDPGCFSLNLARSLDVCADILHWCGQPEQTAAFAKRSRTRPGR